MVTYLSYEIMQPPREHIFMELTKSMSKILQTSITLEIADL